MRNVFICCIALALLVGCTQKIPQDALNLPPESLANRQMQTRIFETTNNKAMLSSASNVMQDLGFTLEEAEFPLGVITGSKRRDATSGGQVAGAVLLAVLSGVPQHYDKEQVIRVSMVMRGLEPRSSPAATPKSSKDASKKSTTPITEEAGRSTVRVTFQRIIFDTAGNVTRAEQINDPEIYSEFFDKLSQAVFLEAHQI